MGKGHTREARGRLPQVHTRMDLCALDELRVYLPQLAEHQRAEAFHVQCDIAALDAHRLAHHRRVATSVLCRKLHVRLAQFSAGQSEEWELLGVYQRQATDVFKQLDIQQPMRLPMRRGRVRAHARTIG